MPTPRKSLAATKSGNIHPRTTKSDHGPFLERKASQHHPSGPAASLDQVSHHSAHSGHDHLHQTNSGAGNHPENPLERTKSKKQLESRQTEHSKELIRAFKTIKYFLMLIGQMPFVIKPKKDGTYSFKFYKCSLQVFIYFIMFFLSTSVYLMVTLGIISFIAGWTILENEDPHTIIVIDKTSGISETLKWERYLVRQEMVATIVVWSWLTVAFTGSVYIVAKSNYYVHYMNYFNRVVQIMDMDMTPGVGRYVFFNNMLTLTVGIVLVVGFGISFVKDLKTQTGKNTASVIANFMLRLFAIEVETLDWKLRLICQIAGLLIMIYALFASRANVIQFLFFSQLLKNGSKIWNERLKKVLTHQTNNATEKTEGDGKPNAEENQFGRRLEPKLVYKDHLMLVQLYQMTENVFGWILFPYYSLTIIAVVMEIYQLAAMEGFGTHTTGDTEEETNKLLLLQDRLGHQDNLDVSHHHELISTTAVCCLLLVQNVFFCYRTTVDAAKAYEYAMEGFNILRRHGLMYCRNKTDRNFVLSLYFSFAKNNPLQLTAGGYFAVNKVLLVTLVSTILNWAISIYQTKVDQWK